MNAKLLRGSLDTIIISLLKDGREMYGYEITKKVGELTNGEVQLTEGALYPALHRMEGRGLLVTQTKRIGNRYRKYYKLTEKGKIEIVDILGEMKTYLSAMEAIINMRIS